MTSVPIALILGIVGIIIDKRKSLAITTTIIAGALVTYYLLMILMFNLARC